MFSRSLNYARRSKTVFVYRLKLKLENSYETLKSYSRIKAQSTLLTNSMRVNKVNDYELLTSNSFIPFDGWVHLANRPRTTERF